MAEAVRAGRFGWVLVFVIGWLTLPSVVSAHVLDAYVQATIVDIEPGDIRLKINLTPGVEIAEPFLLMIDRNDDGVISAREATIYAESLKRDLTARLDDRVIKLKLIECKFPEPAELRTGMGIIQIEFAMMPGSFAAGTHKLALENRHLPSIGEYLFNAAKPGSALIQIVRQTRNKNQSNGEVEFSYSPRSRSAASIGLAASLGIVIVVLAGIWRTCNRSPR